MGIPSMDLRIKALLCNCWEEGGKGIMCVRGGMRHLHLNILMCTFAHSMYFVNLKGMTLSSLFFLPFFHPSFLLSLSSLSRKQHMKDFVP